VKSSLYYAERVFSRIRAGGSGPNLQILVHSVFSSGNPHGTNTGLLGLAIGGIRLVENGINSLG